MNKLIILITFILLTTLSQSCGIFKDQRADYQTIQLTSVEKGKTISMGSASQIAMVEKAPFNLAFHNKRYDPDNEKYHSAKLAAFRKQSALSTIKTGMESSDVACFKPGTGMAPSESGMYSALIFKKTAHHYLTYQNDDQKRVYLAKQQGDFLKLEFPVHKVIIDGEVIPFDELSLDQFYLALFIDKNLNNVIDQGELKKITVNMN